MDDAALVRGFERVGDLQAIGSAAAADRCRRSGSTRCRDSPSTSSMANAGGSSLDDGEDLGDVRMVQGRERLRFAFETRQPVGSAAKNSGRTLMATSRLSSYRARDTPRPCRPRRSARRPRSGRGGCRGRQQAWRRRRVGAAHREGELLAGAMLAQGAERERRPGRTVRSVERGQVVAPPQQLPAPAVQPKQCRPVTIRRVARAREVEVAGQVDDRLRRPATSRRSSIWLKSQS